MSWIRLTLFAVTLLMASGISAFLVVNLVHDPTASAAADIAEGAREGENFWNLSSLEEAELTAGYPIASPAFLPAGFVPGDNIIVTQPSFATLPRVVQRFWHHKDDPAYNFSIMQTPLDSGLGGGEAVTINGVPGLRNLLPPEPPARTLPLLVLSWRNGGYTYYLHGFLGSHLTEETLLKIAASIRLE